MKLTPAQIREIVILTFRGEIEERDRIVKEYRKRFEDSQKYLNQKQEKNCV